MDETINNLITALELRGLAVDSPTEEAIREAFKQALAERTEQCAKICNVIGRNSGGHEAEECATQIRALTHPETKS